MKVGFNLYLWTDRVEPRHYAILKDLKAAGYDGVEVPILAGPPEEYARLSRVLDDLGLARTTAGAFLDPGKDPLSPERAVRAAALRDSVEMLDRAQAVGASLMAGPFYQVLGQFTGQGPTEDELQRAADFHLAMGEAAAARGVVVALEPLNRFEAYLINLARDAEAHVKRVGHPNIAMMFDTFHANIEERDPVRAYVETAASTVHIHISENDRGAPGNGHVRWAETFRAIKASGYDGWLTIEAFGRGLPSMAAACRIWRDLTATPEEVYLTGIRTIREGWAAA
ncbi:MAG: isomerase [Caulobacterales bacterium 68-7]|nr:MAG: isomerase [Caulobacterales bacterium 68-7]